MRKLLVFLLLLGAGLFLLYWLDRSRLASGPKRADIPPVPGGETEAGTQGFQPGGPSQLTLYDEETRLPLYKVKSEDTRTQDGEDVLTGVVLELFDRDTEGLVELRVHAERARMKRAESGTSLQPRWEKRLELEGVQAEILAGVTLAPLTFETPTARVDLADGRGRRFSGEAPFSGRSPELSFDGRGFDFRMDEGRLEIAHEGRIKLLRAGAVPATLTATGTGSLRAFRSAGQEAVTLEALEGAVLEPGADNPGRLAARQMTLRARPRGPGETELALEHLEAEGDVDWTSGEAHFQGQRLDAAFQPGGRIDHAHLEGEPRAELRMVLADPLQPAAQRPEPRRVVLEGQDSMDVTWEEGGYRLHVESLPPAPGATARVPSVVTSDFRLQSASAIDGWLSEDQKRARFQASGGVVVTGGGATLETASFEVAIEPDASGETILLGTASGGARLEGLLTRAGRKAQRFTLTSPDGLEIERSARGWRVVESTHVVVSLEDPDGFQARADRVVDFVVPESTPGELAPGGMRFRASGAVEVEFGAGRFGGEELELLGVAPVPHFVLRGTSASKAYLAVENGQARAREVEVTGDTLEARGEVTGSAEFEADGGSGVRTTFAGDHMSLDRSESLELLPGERLRTLRLVAEGHAQGTVVANDQTLVLRSQRFSAENRVRLVEGAPAPIELGSLFIAEGAVHADFLASGRDLSIDCQHLEIERTANDVESGFRQLTATDNVRFQSRLGEREEVDVGGEGELLVFDSDRRGSLEPGPHGRVTLFGKAGKRQVPFRLTGDRVDFELSETNELSLLALRPELRMLGLRARAEHFTVDERNGAALSGSVRASGTNSAHMPYTLEADQILLVGRRPAESEEGGDAPVDAQDQLDSLTAEGHVGFHLGDGLNAHGERLIVRRTTGLLHLEGSPAAFEFGPTRLETEWVDFDPILQVLVATGRGRMLPTASTRPGAVPDSDTWLLDFLSASTLMEPDSVVLILQEPLFRTAQFTSALRSSWAILWLNREAIQDSDRRNQLLAGLERAFGEFKSLPNGKNPLEKLTLLRSAELAGLVREIYFEGPVEVLAEGELVARADAMYLDVSSQHGWLARATLNLGGQFLGQRREKLIVKADWLRLSSDASMRADRATVTSCDFDEPHVRVVTGDLEIEPTSGLGKEHYQLILKDNRIELYDTLRIPLPTIDVATDKELQPLWPTLSLADSARFGTLFSFAFTRPARAIGRFFDSLVRPGAGKPEPAPAPAPAPAPSAEGAEGAETRTPPVAPAPPRKPRSDVDAHYKIDASYLGSRGGLLDLGLEIEAKEDYWFDLHVGLVLDTGTDRGYVRLDPDERDTLRRWIRSQAYFDHGKSVWSFAFSNQSDAAVQSEFFESQFVRYERGENYVQWRRTSDENFVEASVKLRSDEFRSQVEELPSASAYRGRSPLFTLGPLSVLHTGDLHAAYLRRRTGTEPHSPFEPSPTFGDITPGLFGSLDGLGDREVLRVDTEQALELPIPLGASWKLTPFVSARATAWSEGVDPADSPTRLLAEAGARLATTLWTRTSGGKLHQIAPFVEYRTELERKDENGTPVTYDGTERLLSGDFLRFGSRARFAADAEGSTLDVDLVAGYGRNRSDGRPDGWLPLEVFGRLLLEPLGHEFEVFHDARYDLESSRTVYSLVSLGTHLGEEWGVQLAYQRGLDVNQEPLFKTASLSGLYRWTEKWEFEGRESFSLLDDSSLDTRFLVRRYGHDIVFEIETSVREGEGSSFGVNVKPRFGYRPPRVGYVPW